MNRICWFTVSCCFVIGATMLYIAFIGGRHFESNRCSAEKETIRMEYIRDRMDYYGPGHYYFEAKGKYYFVTDPKDLDNEKKWRRVR